MTTHSNISHPVARRTMRSAVVNGRIRPERSGGVTVPVFPVKPAVERIPGMTWGVTEMPDGYLADLQRYIGATSRRTGPPCSWVIGLVLHVQHHQHIRSARLLQGEALAGGAVEVGEADHRRCRTACRSSAGRPGRRFDGATHSRPSDAAARTTHARCMTLPSSHPAARAADTCAAGVQPPRGRGPYLLDEIPYLVDSNKSDRTQREWQTWWVTTTSRGDTRTRWPPAGVQTAAVVASLSSPFPHACPGQMSFCPHAPRGHLHVRRLHRLL